MELQQILSKMEADGWEISNDFKIAHGHFLQYFLETVEAALRQPPVSGLLPMPEFCENCEDFEFCSKECYCLKDCRQ